MPAAGDRVVLEGNKVGGGRREGEIIRVSGQILEIRWLDGNTSLMAPAAGALRVLPPQGKRLSSGKAKTGGSKKATAKAKK